MTRTHTARVLLPRWLAAGFLLLCVAWPRAATAQTVQLAKTSLGGSGSFTFTTTNLDSPGETLTTSTPGTPVQSAIVATVLQVAQPVTLTEAVPVGWQIAQADCVDNSGNTPGTFGSLTGDTLTIDAAVFDPAAEVVCTFVNALLQLDLAITKQASPTVVASGGTVAYALTASNIGTADATDVVLADTPGSGLSCTSAGTCSASGGASCPAVVPAAALFGSGVTVPSLPAGGSITVTVDCTVTASGD